MRHSLLFALAISLFVSLAAALSASAQNRPNKKPDLQYSCDIQRVGKIGALQANNQVNVPMEVSIWTAEGLCERKLPKEVKRSEEAVRVVQCKTNAQMIEAKGTRTDIWITRASGELRGNGWVSVDYVRYTGTCRLVR